jgi:hypothetical protein
VNIRVPSAVSQKLPQVEKLKVLREVWESVPLLMSHSLAQLESPR